MSAPRVIVQTKRDAPLINAAGFVRSGTVSLVGVTLAILHGMGRDRGAALGC
jgi:hypothetical protein